MVHDHHPGVGLNAFGNFVWIHKSIGIGTNTGDRDIVIALKVIGRSQYAVMLHSRNDHMITRIQHAGQRCVHGVGCVLRERHTPRVSCETKELAQHASCLNDHGFGLHGEFVPRPAWVHSMASEELIHELVYRLRLRQGGCRIVKIIVVFHVSNFP